MKVSELELLGFSNNGAKIFIKLLSIAYSAPKEISNDLLIPIQTVYQEIKILEQMGVIESRGTAPKEYFIVDPQKGLKGLIIQFKTNLTQLTHLADRILDEVITSYQERFQEGTCVKRFAFFGYTDYTKGKDFLIDQLSNAQLEVLIYNLPAELLVEFKATLQTLLQRNVWIGIYIDRNSAMIIPDVPSIHVFKGELQDIAKQGMFLFNDEESIQAEICIDNERFISIWFKQPFTDHNAMINSFYSPTTVISIKNKYLAVLDRDAVLNAPNTEKINPVDYIKNAVKSGYVSKHAILELAQKDSYPLTGSEIKRIIKELEDAQIIEIQKSKLEKGRPREELKLIKE